MTTHKTHTLRAALAALAIIISIAAAPPHRATAAESATATVTIEADTGAILVTGPKSQITSLHQTLSTSNAASWPIDRIAGLIKNDYPELDVQLFMRGSETAGGHEQSFQMPLRRAILSGLLPPIETLTQRDASSVLNAAGFSCLESKDWAEKGGPAKAALLSAAAGKLVVLDGTDPQDTVIIYVANPGKAEYAEPK